jgi:hypothetical protein
MDATGAMSDGNDFPGIGHDRIGIEMRLDALVGLRAELPAQLSASTVVKIDDSAPVVVMGFMAEIKQTFHYGVRDAALLKPGLRMMGHCEHDLTPFPVVIEARLQVGRLRR